MLKVPFLTFVTSSLLVFLTHGGVKYPLFYTFPGFEEKIPLDLSSDSTVGETIHQICEERKIPMDKRKRFLMSFGSEVLLNGQSLADAGVGADAVIHIMITLTPTQHILRAFSNTNLRDTLQLGGYDDELNCCEWIPMVECDQTGIPVEINLKFNSNLEGSVDISLFPDTIQRFLSHGRLVTGVIDFFHLPRDLKGIFILDSQFTADFSLMKRDRWPKYLVTIHLTNNDLFFGRFDCSELPHSLKYLHIGRNVQLSDILFHDLPPQMKSIVLDANILSTLNMSEQMPTFLKTVSVRNIVINGSINLQGLRNCSSLQFACDFEQRSQFESAAFDSGFSLNFV